MPTRSDTACTTEDVWSAARRAARLRKRADEAEVEARALILRAVANLAQAAELAEATGLDPARRLTPVAAPNVFGPRYS